MKSDVPDRAFEFAKRIVRLCQTLDGKPGVGRTLSRQLIRSGTSVGANVEEGQASQSRADFVAKYSIACKEARETLYWLRLLGATDVIDPDRLQSLLQECHELVSVLTAIVKRTRANNEC
jgi:four helix bundle protein